MMISMVPKIGAYTEVSTEFITSAKPNHWGRSDLRAYLNGVEKINFTLPFDTTHSEKQSNGYYESQFTNNEYSLIQPFTYSTNILDSNGNTTSTYNTTDIFWLPSGNFDSDDVLSFGTDDLSSDLNFNNVLAGHIIPISYWSGGLDDYAWLRSLCYDRDVDSLRSYRDDIGGVVSNYSGDICDSEGIAPACKIDLSSVIFASSVSAYFIGSGATKLEILGSKHFGKKISNDLPDYGMYLKTENTTSTFTPSGLTFIENDLTVEYTGGKKDQYVVVQAFKEDDLINGTTSYAATKKISADSDTSVEIDVTEWGLSSLDGYTIKVWMEDASSRSLATATVPVTFISENSSISKGESSAIKNQRVFAMKEDLQTSWGDFSALNSDDLTNVKAGKSVSGSYSGDEFVTGKIAGVGATNQKIYFGTDSSGNPLQFWIAGRETYDTGKSPKDGDGKITADGNIMTLYQAKSIETKQFNSSTSSYEVEGKASMTLQIEDAKKGSSYPEDSITFKQGSNDLDKSSLKWEHREPGSQTWSTGMPTTSGKYEIRCYAEGTTNYERTYSSVVHFTFIAAPTTSNFDFYLPSNLTYNGTAKEASVTVKSGITGMGNITVKYFDSNGKKLTNPPTDIGIYTVKIDVESGESYGSINNLTDSNKWKFEITAANPTTSNLNKTPSTNAVYGQKLADLNFNFTDKIGTPEDLDGTALDGTWSWKDVDADSVLFDNLGERNFIALFTPTNTNYSTIEVTVTVNVELDRSTWGTAQIRKADSVTQYVIEDTDSINFGMTSVELTTGNVFNNIVWLHETSGDSSAWYGLKIDSNETSIQFDKGYRFYVQWLSPGETGYDEIYAQLDEAQKIRVEDDNGWIFRTGILDHNGNKVQPSERVNLYAQIDDDWDLPHLNAYCIASGTDESVSVDDVQNFTYPEGTDDLGIMTLNHFSPHFIFDELTDAEKSMIIPPTGNSNNPSDTTVVGGLNITSADKLFTQSTDNFDNAKPDFSDDTGDLATQLLISGLTLILVLSLGIMIKLLTHRKNFKE